LLNAQREKGKLAIEINAQSCLTASHLPLNVLPKREEIEREEQTSQDDRNEAKQIEDKELGERRGKLGAKKSRLIVTSLAQIAGRLRASNSSMDKTKTGKP